MNWPKKVKPARIPALSGFSFGRAGIALDRFFIAVSVGLCAGRLGNIRPMGDAGLASADWKAAPRGAPLMPEVLWMTAGEPWVANRARTPRAAAAALDAPVFAWPARTFGVCSNAAPMAPSARKRRRVTPPLFVLPLSLRPLTTSPIPLRTPFVRA